MRGMHLMDAELTILSTIGKSLIFYSVLLLELSSRRQSRHRHPSQNRAGIAFHKQIRKLSAVNIAIPDENRLGQHLE